MASRKTREQAQSLLMTHVGNALGYWRESYVAEGIENKDEFAAELKKQADRIAKMFGFEEAWSN